MPVYRRAIFHRLADLFDTHFARLQYSYQSAHEEISDLPARAVPTTTFYLGGTRISYGRLSSILKEIQPEVVITHCALALLSTWMLFRLRRKFGFRLIFWTHGFQGFKEESPLSLGNRVRLVWFRWADAVVFYTPRCRDEVLSVADILEKSFVAPNTIDNGEFAALPVEQWIERRCAQFASTENPLVLLYIGRLTKKKQVDRLPIILEHLKKYPRPVRLEVIGDGTERDSLERRLAEMGADFQMHGPLYSLQEKLPILQRSHFLIMPGYVSLSAVESLGCAIPVAYFADDAVDQRHSPEVDYLEPGRNALQGDLEKEMAASLHSVASEPNQYRGLAISARETFLNECSLERQISGVQSAVNYVCRPSLGSTKPA